MPSSDPATARQPDALLARTARQPDDDLRSLKWSAKEK
jgi:hypothetical protein